LKLASSLPRLELKFRVGDKKKKFAVLVILECLCVERNLVFKNNISFALLCLPFSSVIFREPQTGQVKDGAFILYYILTKDMLLEKMQEL
jgi:hypothetical protein